MVFGNMGNTSGTGVAFTRNPRTGEKKIYGDYLINAQGEDVVAGIRTPSPLPPAARNCPRLTSSSWTSTIARKPLQGHAGRGVHHRARQALDAADPQRQAHRPAAIKIAVDMANEGLITKEEAVMRVTPDQVNMLLHPQFDANAKEAG